MKLAVVSRFTDSKSQGHHITFVDTLSAYRFPMETFLFAQESYSSKGVQNVFGRSLKSTHNFITIPMFLSNSEKRLQKSIRDLGIEKVIFYEGALYDFWLALRLLPLFPKIDVYFNFHYAGDWARRLTSARFVRQLKLSIRQADAETKSNITWMAESSRLTKLVRDKLQVDVLEFPVFANLTDDEKENCSVKEYDVLIPNLPQHLLGWDEKLYKYLIRELPDIRVVSQNTSSFNPDYEGMVRIPGALSKQNYVKVNSASKVVALPYTSEFHRWGSSGRFEDALALGTFPIVPSYTPMAERLESASFTMPKSTDPEEFAGLIVKYLKTNSLELPKSRTPQQLVDVLTKKDYQQTLGGSSPISLGYLLRLCFVSLLTSKPRHFILENLRDTFNLLPRWFSLGKR
jgi:hypothetical protein